MFFGLGKGPTQLTEVGEVEMVSGAAGSRVRFTTSPI